MTMLKTLGLAAIAAAAIGAPASAQAAELFTNRAAFVAMGGAGAYDVDFEDGTSGPLAIVGDAVGATGNPGLFGSVNGSNYVQFQLGTAAIGTPSSLFLGFDLRPYFDAIGSDAGEVVEYLTDTGETGTFTLSSTNVASFLGFRFDRPIESIAFGVADGGADGVTYLGIDNIVGFAAAVPEPSSWALMLTGFAMLGLSLRYRRRGTTVAFG